MGFGKREVGEKLFCFFCMAEWEFTQGYLVFKDVYLILNYAQKHVCSLCSHTYSIHRGYVLMGMMVNYPSEIDIIVWDSSSPPALMDLHLREVAALYVRCIRIPPLLISSLWVKE